MMSATMVPPVLVTFTEIVSLSGAAPATVRRWVREHKLPGPLPLSRGGKLWFDRELVMAALRGRPAE
jgi:hypothetical protein